MAPLLHDTDLFLSSHDDAFDRKAIVRPLHENTIRTPRRVSFGAIVVTFEVMGRSNYTREELEASWFDRGEMRQMKENAKSEARLFESGLLFEGPDVSIRGLESRTRKGMKRKRQSRINAYAAVFFEVDCQQEKGYYDDDIIADAYFTYSEPCTVTAQMIAKRDEIEAVNVYDNQKSGIFGAYLCHALANLPAAEGLASSAA